MYNLLAHSSSLRRPLTSLWNLRASSRLLCPVRQCRGQHHQAAAAAAGAAAAGLAAAACDSAAASTATANLHNSTTPDLYLLAAVIDQLRSTVWGIPAGPRPSAAAAAAAAAVPSIRLVAGTRSAPRLAEAAAVLPLPGQLLPGDLHPLSLSSGAFGLLLQSLLLSKAAKRAEVRALVLSAPYLPSQLEAFHATAAKQRHSLAVLVGSSELHVVVSQLPWEEDELGGDESSDNATQQQQWMPGWQQVVMDALGQASLLDPGRLAAAEDAEEALLAQRRLLSTAAWNAAAQQLKAKHCLLPWLAGLAVVSDEQLRSLRGLAATHGLHLTVEEAQQQQQQAAAAAAGVDRWQLQQQLQAWQ
ncbi:hypothetical protein COO60DRAFT_394808 [Scenedesmus sp. NREL 46B-D3]|nr:hypothetical protein COO60DRAFT_394808 [Scenedesmus sp. NREL 46B-D3]